MVPFRIGFGFDVHQLTEGRDFWLGGIKIKHSKGALGHSDADVLIHAICDSLLGASGLGDIGIHFPDTDISFKNIDSKVLLQKVVDLLKSKGFFIVNIDSSLVLEKPKISVYIPEMKNCLCEILCIEESCLSIKATTNEKMGYVGREEGIAAYSVALISK